MSLSRRNFFKSSSIAAAAASLTLPAAAASNPVFRGFRNGQRPRHIIHMVADGMSSGTLTAADALSWIMRGRGLTWIEMHKQQNVHSGLMDMRSLNSIVTDSSAASSSWGSGTRIINGKVNQLGDGTNLTTLYDLFPQKGWKTGLVTTTEITHATPAGFATNAKSRDYATKIAPQYLEKKVHVLLGGGSKFFDPAYRKDKRELVRDFTNAGYHHMTTAGELAVAPIDKPWLGLFARSHLPFTLDQRQSDKLKKEVPYLAVMTEAALRNLERYPHFILQVEGGRVDHGCHEGDVASAIYDLIAFDEAVDVVVRFCQRHPDTLVVITTDHGNANLAINGMGHAYGNSSWLLENLKNTKMSFGEMVKLIRDKPKEPDIEKDEQDKDEEKKREDAMPKEEREKEKARKKGTVVDPKRLAEIIYAGTGYNVTTKKTEMLRPYWVEKGECLYDGMKGDLAQLGQLMANYYGIGFTGTAHTGDYVQITSFGPGAERFRGFIQNTDVFYHYLALGKIDFRNPTEPLIAGVPDASHLDHLNSYA